MSLRPPARFSAAQISEGRLDALDYEVLAEKAASLGRAGQRAEQCLDRLRAYEGGAEERSVLLKEAADAVYAYFLQREFCGFRRHDDVVKAYGIPREVIVRLGAI